MNDLVSKKCIPCEIGTPPIALEDAQKLHQQVSDWDLESNHHIQKIFKFKDFKQALEFVNKVGEIAESEGHHPDILIEYNKVTLKLMTHASKGLTDNDFILAAKINTIS